MENLELILKLHKPFSFEGETVTELDLTGLEDISGGDMITAKRQSGAGKNTPMPELTMEFAFAMAAKVTEKPMEFFQQLPGREAIRVKNAVTGFFFGDD